MGFLAAAMALPASDLEQGRNRQDDDDGKGRGCRQRRRGCSMAFPGKRAAFRGKGGPAGWRKAPILPLKGRTVAVRVGRQGNPHE